MATLTDYKPILLAYGLCILAALGVLWAAQPYVIDGGLWAALWAAFAADVAATIVIFIFSRVYSNSSFYDAYWSVIPPLLMPYWMVLFPDSLSEPRTWIVLALVWAWGVRLTVNWTMHWQGLQHEDWRYPMVKARAGRFEAGADFLGIHLFPTIQVFLGCLPLLIVVSQPQGPLGWLDALAFIVTGGAILIELLSDLQLHAFLRERKPGQLLDRGLWSWSRHPNYFGEISFWVGLALFGLAVAPQYWWCILPGAVSMTIMFVTVSVPFLDQRSLERRPDYGDYMRRVSGIVPLPPRKA